MDDVATPKFRLGKKPFVPSDNDFKLADLLDAASPLPGAPHSFGYGRAFGDWGMLGNDQYGDCVFAGSDHETMLFNHLSRRPIAFVDEDALGDYAAVTGFDPNDPNTDQGTDVREAYNYRRKTGLMDSSGNHHKIDAFASIDAKNFDLMRQCVYVFGAVGMGFEVPDSIWTQVDNNEVWDVVDPDGGIDGGHYVPVVGSTSPDHATFITWGQRMVMTRAFYEKYNDEAWVPLSKEELLYRAAGEPSNVRHINWDTLSSMLESL